MLLEKQCSKMPEYSLNDFTHARNQLSFHAKNPQKFSANPHGHMIYDKKTKLEKDYTSKSLRRYHISNVIFSKSKFINSAAAGAKFLNCEFENCNIRQANFQNCDINHFSLSSNDKSSVISSNFNDSCIVDFNIHNVNFKHCVFNGTLFCNGIFQDTILFSDTFENTVFDNVKFQRVTFSDLNIDYAEFHCIEMENTILPFSQIPYAFGLLDYLINTQDKVYITSASSPNKRITAQEYISLLEDFEIYYLNTKSYFPLANIYLCQGKTQLAYQAITDGMYKALSEHDYRVVKYLCKLISVSSFFEYGKRQNLYYEINEVMTKTIRNQIDQYRFFLQKPLIEYYLLRNNFVDNTATLELLIKTGYDYTEISKTNNIYEYLENLVSALETEKGSHKIEVTHHSSPTITVIVEDIYLVLIAITPLIYAALKGFLGLLHSYQDYLSKREEYKEQKILSEIQNEGELLTNEQKRIEIEKAKLEMEQLRLEMVLKEKAANLETDAKEMNRKIQENKIQIKSIKHAIFCLDNDSMCSDLQHFFCD